MRALRRLILWLLRRRGLLLVRIPTAAESRDAEGAQRLLIRADREVARLGRRLSPLMDAVRLSRAKDGQDVLAAWLNCWKPGFFVDLGAEDGLRKNNTWLLENLFGWDGVCVEANPSVHGDLRSNRSVAIETRAVFDRSGQSVAFRDTTVSGKGGLSQIAGFDSGVDLRPAREVVVTTATLREILEDCGAPRFVHYLSIDVEGAEAAALFELDRLPFRFGLITCEHNFGARQRTLESILVSAGYHIVLGDFSRNEVWAVDSLDRLSTAGSVADVADALASAWT